MSLVQRRLFLLFFVILFVATAPIIILYSTGYRFDWNSRIFVHSGSITVESWPRDVDIFLNDEKQVKISLNSINNSYTINGLRPGRYNLKCSKEGYTSWEKNIEVHSGISTEFWNVVLYPNTSREMKTYNTPTIQQFFLSPRDTNEIVYFTRQDNRKVVSLLNTEEDSSEEIYSTEEFDFLDPAFKENVEWSTDNKQILIPFKNAQEEKVYIIARIQEEGLENILDIRELFPDEKGAFEKVRWMFDKDNELVVLTKDHKLWYVDIEKADSKILLDENVSSFNFAGNRIYYTKLPNNLVWEIKSNDISTKRQITNISAYSENDDFVEMVVYDEYRIAIINRKKQLFVFNEEKEKGEKFMSEISSGIEGIQFSNDGKKLLYWSGNEIWTLLLRDWEVQPIRMKNEKILVTRYSQPIKNVQWVDNYENVLFSVGETVKSAEIDTRDRINIVDIEKSATSLEERDLFYNKNNQLLVYRILNENKYNLKSILLIDKGGFLGF